MLRQVLKKLLSLSAIGAFGFVLLMLDPASDSLVSEAQACDYQTCMYMCFTTCGGPHNPECPPWDMEDWCHEQCVAMCT